MIFIALIGLGNDGKKAFKNKRNLTGRNYQTCEQYHAMEWRHVATADPF